MRPLPIAAWLLVLALVACSDPEDEARAAHRAGIEAWHRERVAELVSDTGQLTQVGLHRLAPGSWSVGSAEEADLLLPERAPARLGELEVDGEVVRFTAAAGVSVHRFGSEPLERVEQIELTTPAPEGGPTTLVCDRMLLHVVVRGGVPLLRVRDQDSPARDEFAAPARFPVDPRYRVSARLVPGTAGPQTLFLEGGLQSTTLGLGLIEFELDGRTHRLQPTYNPDGSLFIVFADATTGTESYPGGRFLDAPALDANGVTELDFNRAYTPVCAWNAYSTCPRPPPENRLATTVHAGERYAKAK